MYFSNQAKISEEMANPLNPATNSKHSSNVTCSDSVNLTDGKCEKQIYSMIVIIDSNAISARN